MPLTTYSLSDHVATITLTRDAKRNAINQEMAQGLLEGLARAEAENAQVVILRANPGVSVWCAGHDLAELDPQNLLAENPTLQLAHAIRSFGRPVIAMVEGQVYAGGLIVLISCDLAIAANNAHIAIPSNKLGIPLDAEFYAYCLRVMGLHLLKELLFTASPLSAARAYQIGFYNELVDAEVLEQTTWNIARRILACSPDSIALAKKHLNLLAQQTAWDEQQLKEARARDAQILNSPATKHRIAAMLHSLNQPTPKAES